MSLPQIFLCIRIVSYKIVINKCDIHIEIIPMAKEKHTFIHDETIITYILVCTYLYILQLVDVHKEMIVNIHPYKWSDTITINKPSLA